VIEPVRVVRFAAIGSRTPTREAEQWMRQIVGALCGNLQARPYYELTHNLRDDVVFHAFSGGAAGMDTAAESTVELVRGRLTRFLPWEGFGGHKVGVVCPSLPNWEQAQEICRHYHPAPDKLHGRTLSLLARDSYQVLDQTLDDPVDFVLCWTSNGQAIGGTGQAIRIAEDHDIPVFNLQDPKAYNRLRRYLRRFWQVGVVAL